MPIGTVKIVFFALWLFFIAVPAFSQQAKLEFLTENYPPYNYLEDGELKGTSVELLLVIMAQLGTPIMRADIRVIPWARAVRELNQGPNRVLFTMAKTNARAPLFQWAGPISYDYLSLIAKKEKKFNISNVNQLGQLRIGVVRDDVSEELMLGIGVAPNNIEKSNNSVNIARMLAADRIDLWPIDSRGADTILASVGANPADYEVVANLRAVPLYYAFSKEVDPNFVLAFQQALEWARNLHPELFPDNHPDIRASDLPLVE